MVRIDLHTHSLASPDGGLTLRDYKQVLAGESLDVIAVTDHNTVAEALELKNRLKSRLIVGEEITTKHGELIGLYLTEDIPPGMSAVETAKRIKQQGGLVYIPHPLERVQRHGLKMSALKSLLPLIDIVETYNGRSISLAARLRARRFARAYGFAESTASDAHGPSGLGHVASVIERRPTSDTLVRLLQSGTAKANRRPLGAYLEPSRNRRRSKKLGAS